MQNQHGQHVASHPHIQALRSRHHTLDQMIENLAKTLATDDAHLRELKKNRLRVMDEIDICERRMG